MTDADRQTERFRRWVLSLHATRQGEPGAAASGSDLDDWDLEWSCFDLVVPALNGAARPLSDADLLKVRDFSREGHIRYGSAQHYLDLLLADAGVPGCGKPADEPYGWGLIANVSCDYLGVNRWGTPAPGTSAYASGAKVWVVPPLWGDGGENVLVIGTSRGSRGRRSARQVIVSDKLVNHRAKPVYSHNEWKLMLTPYEGRLPQLWSEDGSRESVTSIAARHSNRRLWSAHLGGTGWGEHWHGPLHPRDQDCPFCEGATAGTETEAALDANPYAIADTDVDDASWSDGALWRDGWHYAKQLREQSLPPGFAMAEQAEQALLRHEKALILAPDLVGRLVDDIRTVREQDPLHHWSTAPVHFTMLSERLPYVIGRVVARVEGNFVADAWAE